MNRKDRRDQLERAKKRLAKAKAWVLVTFDGTIAPLYSYDVSILQDKQDIRHHAMHKLSLESERICSEVIKFREKQVVEYGEKQKVAAAKEKRSEELAKVITVSEVMRGDPVVGSRTFQQEEVKVA
jgi:hypothetical protein